MRHDQRFTATALAFAGAASALIGVAPNAHAEARTHDGFYLQLDAGLGYLHTSADVLSSEVSYSGLSFPSALLMGGTVGPVVIGGGIMGDYAPSPSGKVNGGSSVPLDDVTMTLVGIGVFADYYVDPHGGLHFQPFVGWGGLETSYKGDSGGSDPTGLFLAIGGGYDWWVGDQWSIGVMGRVAYAPLKLNDVTYSTIAPALLASFTYH